MMSSLPHRFNIIINQQDASHVAAYCGGELGVLTEGVALSLLGVLNGAMLGAVVGALPGEMLGTLLGVVMVLFGGVISLPVGAVGNEPGAGVAGVGVVGVVGVVPGLAGRGCVLGDNVSGRVLPGVALPGKIGAGAFSVPFCNGLSAIGGVRTAFLFLLIIS